MFAYGVYKLIFPDEKVCYLDFRDSRIREGIFPNYGVSIDLYFLFDNGNLSMARTTPYDFYPFNNGKLFKYNEIFNLGIPQTTEFNSFWQNCLVLIPSETGNKPRLVWGAHPTITVENYAIYRAVSSTPLSNPESSANLIATVSSSTFEYTDNSILLGPVDYVYYFVKGKYRQGYLLTSRTNIVDTRGGLYKENTNEEINIPDKLEITNFPNPFNPTTTINYAIPENGFTELKVYNIYGELVEILVSGNKEAGSYSVRFPSSGGCLASGVYLYTLTSGR